MSLISAGEAGPGVAVLINDDGRYVLRSGDRDIEVDGAALMDALTRSKPVADLVARSQTPIDGMSAPIERSLEHFGCTLVRESAGECA